VPPRVNSWRENQVGMIGHDYGGIQVISKGVIMANRFEHDVARPFRQYSPILGDERDEVPFSISLQMRQIAAVEGHKPAFPRFGPTARPHAT